MSYIRSGGPLFYFEGESKLYVFPSASKKGKKMIGYIEDYDTEYNDNASFAELIVNIVFRQTNDEKYAWKIAGVLAKKLNIKRRKHPLTDREWEKEWKKLLSKDKDGINKSKG